MKTLALSIVVLVALAGSASAHVDHFYSGFPKALGKAFTPQS